MQDDFMKRAHDREAKGFEFIKQYVEKYPNTEHPSVDDDLVELFMNGASALGFKHIVCVGDDTFCPHCKEKNGTVEKKGLSLDALIGNNVICHWCYVTSWQDKEWHDTATCDCPVERDECWTKRDCMAVLESYEHSYKAIMEDESWL